MASTMLSIVAAGLFFGTSAAAAQCSKYTVDTTEGIYQFNNYNFLDFRDKDNSFLQNEKFTSQYRPQSWDNGKFQNRVDNIAITSDTVDGEKTNMLSLFARQKGSQATAAELESADSDYFYSSVRMGVRVTGDAGACAGLFFYHSDTQETDIEILTREQKPDHLDAETMQPSPATTDQVHFTNQPRLTKTVKLSVLNKKNNAVSKAVSPSATKGTQTIIGSWEQFNDYRIDWIPGVTHWWQNGNLSHSADKNLIQNPSSWMLNIWSNGDPSWSGAMAPGTEARMDILWIEMAYNKLAEGAPQKVAAGQQGCQLGVGDGTDLNNPTATAPQTTTAGATDATDATTSTQTVTQGTTNNAVKRAPMKFVA